MNNVNNRKQEPRARLWAYNCQIGLTGLVSAARAGCRNLRETAEHLDVTEEFLQEAIECYKNEYGIGTYIDNYWIMFEPNLQVYEYIVKKEKIRSKIKEVLDQLSQEELEAMYEELKNELGREK